MTVRAPTAAPSNMSIMLVVATIAYTWVSAFL